MQEAFSLCASETSSDSSTPDVDFPGLISKAGLQCSVRGKMFQTVLEVQLQLTAILIRD